ncbi:MAG: hypothetical protein R3266_13640 [Gemmatimonadota bacterium]|nr:hypothetical protein [Gemmatimonadota bacterium]
MDPENDTPEVLREHARRYGVDFDRWRWVTGETGEVSDVVVDGFKLALGEPVPTGRPEPRLVLSAISAPCSAASAVLSAIRKKITVTSSQTRRTMAATSVKRTTRSRVPRPARRD